MMPLPVLNRIEDLFVVHLHYKPSSPIFVTSMCQGDFDCPLLYYALVLVVFIEALHD